MKYPTFTDPNGVLQPFKGVTEGSRGKRVVAFVRKDEGEWQHFGNSVSVDAMDKRVRGYERNGWRVSYCHIRLENQLTLKEIEDINKENNK